jgi:hypothetical protein
MGQRRKSLWRLSLDPFVCSIGCRNCQVVSKPRKGSRSRPQPTQIVGWRWRISQNASELNGVLTPFYSSTTGCHPAQDGFHYRPQEAGEGCRRGGDRAGGAGGSGAYLGRLGNGRRMKMACAGGTGRPQGSAMAGTHAPRMAGSLPAAVAGRSSPHPPLERTSSAHILRQTASNISKRGDGLRRHRGAHF